MIGNGYRQPEDREYTIIAFHKAIKDEAFGLASRILEANPDLTYYELTKGLSR